MKISLSIIAALLLVSTFPLQGQQTLTVYPDEDALLHITGKYPSYEDSNFGNYPLLRSWEWSLSGYSSTMRSLIGVDLSQVPSWATITDAKLYLYGTGSHSTNITTGSSTYKSNASYLRRVVESWDEQLVTWNTQPAVTDSHQAILTNSSTTDQDYIVDVTNLIQDMIDDPENSHGFMLQLQTEEKYTEMRFASSDNADPSLHPKLVITYTKSPYPTIESFEFSNTVWQNSSSDDIDWMRDADGTTSSSTGPSGATHGNYYAYVESSSPNYPNKEAVLISPSYDLSGSNNQISFDYHMYGATMGTLTLEVWNEMAGEWEQLWTKSGNQGDQWYSESLDVGIFTEPTTFRFVGTTGGSYTGDMALDNIKVVASRSASVSGDQNYVYTITPMTQVGLDGPTQRSIQYYDGLGRLVQDVSIASSPTWRDVVKPYAYDSYGRQLRDYLPYTEGEGGAGSFRSDALSRQDDFYADHFELTGSSAYGYSRTVHESSPLNRVLAQGSPGDVYQPMEENTTLTEEHVKVFEYETNTQNEVRCFQVDSDGDLVNDNAYYTENTLYKSVFYDENSSQTEEFKDLLGRVVLKRAYDGSQVLSTYYVYDDLGLLRFVLPPKAEGDNGVPTATALESLCYQYKYDGRKRMAVKKLPGADSVLMVYDSRDRVVATQDGNMKNQNQWLFTKYDHINRPIQTGLMSTNSSISRTSLQGEVNTFYQAGNQMHEEWDSTQIMGYTNASFPSSGSFISTLQMLTINYYDSYDCKGLNWFPDFVFDATNNIDTYQEDNDTTANYNNELIGQVTGTATLVLDGTDTSWVYSSSFYDQKYRVIQSQSTLYPNGSSMTSLKLDFIGTVEESVEMQSVDEVTNKMHYYNTYDHALRPLETHVSINDQDMVLLSQNSYNELGELVEKKLHSEDGASFLQTLDYDYNIRGWLTQINDPTNLSGDKFGMTLCYEDDGDIVNDHSFYNGNISALKWTNAGGDEKAYSYDYDELNRIVSGIYYEDQGSGWVVDGSYVTSYTYDLNGNIMSLSRNGDNYGTPIDILSYTYIDNGNMLKTVQDSPGFGTVGFIDGSSATVEYAYDANGNMTQDLNKGIDIEYNHLSMPALIETTDGTNSDEILYIYDAAGIKWLKLFNTATSNDTTMYAGFYVYKGSGTSGLQLDYLLTAEGTVEMTGSILDEYTYFLKDHLGNTRAVLDDQGVVAQSKDYYPFGMSFSNTQGGDNKYLYNGKEMQDELLGGVQLDWYAFEFRMYDPALGRFPSLDPLADKFSHLSPYNYASNNPVTMIDLWGLQGVDPNKKAARKQIWRGVGNVAFGTVGAVGSTIYMAGSSGIGVGFGGGAALTFSLGEVAVGFAQITDGAQSLKESTVPNESLEKSSTIPGLIANEAGSEHADLIDAAGGLIPGALSGGNVKTVLNGVDALRNSNSAGEVIYNGAEIVDATLDLSNAVDATLNSGNSATDSNSTSSSGSGEPVDLNAPLYPPVVVEPDATRVETPIIFQ